MGFSLFIIDSEQANLNKLDRKGLLHLGKIDKVRNNIIFYRNSLDKLFQLYPPDKYNFKFQIFHDLEVVPLFGDMQIAPFNYVKKTKNFDASKWPMAMAASNSYATRYVT